MELTLGRTNSAYSSRIVRTSILSGLTKLCRWFAFGFDRKFKGRILRLMVENAEILREIRDLLELMAEPALAKRDERLRAALQQIVGKSKQKAEAVVLMDGVRSQAAIRKGCGIDDGNLSRLVKALRQAELIGPDDKYPKLVFPVPSNLIDTVGKTKG